MAHSNKGYLVPNSPLRKPHPAPTSAIDDPDGICVFINKEWLPFVRGACNILQWEYTYTGTPEQIQFAIQQSHALLIALSMGNITCEGKDEMRLRQDPDNACVLQASYDNGQTWVTAFDYGLCFMETYQTYPQNLTLILSDFLKWKTTTINNYNGTVASIDSDLVYDATSDDDDRDLAFCATLEALLITLAEQVKKKQDGFWYQALDLWAAVSLGVGKGLNKFGGFLRGLDNPAAWYLGICMQLTGHVWENAADTFKQTDLSAILDDNIRRELMCYARGNFGGDTLTELIFNGIFDGCSSIQGVSAEVEAFLADFADSTDNYVMFSKIASEYYTEIQNGSVVYTCPCGTWIHTFDFTAESGAASNTSYGLSGWYTVPDHIGSYTSGTGWVATSEGAGGTSYTRQRGIRLRKDFGQFTTITDFDIVYDLTKGDYEGNSSNTAIVQSTLGDSQIKTASQVTNGTGQTCTFTLDDLTNYARIDLITDIDSQSPFTLEGDCTLKSVTFQGRGVNPFV